MSEGQGRNQAQTIGLYLGPALALLIALLPLPEGLSPEGLRVGALLVWMAVWWSTEAIPIPATSLLPIIGLPLIGGATPGQSIEAYMTTTVGLLMGGFVVAMGIERWNLHKRIALNIVAASGDRLKLIAAGFMLATALISAWISNTATTIMMVPIALSVAMSTGDKSGNFGKALLLGICYASSIGGVATPIGTPTNLIAIKWLEENTGATIGFPQWMAFGVPAMLILLPFAWFVTTRGMQSPVKSTESGDTYTFETTRRFDAGDFGKSVGIIAAFVVLFAAVLHFFGPTLSGWLGRATSIVLGLTFIVGLSFALRAIRSPDPLAAQVTVKGAQATVTRELHALGKITVPEKRVAMIFGLVALMWVSRVEVQKLLEGVPGFGWVQSITDMGIAIFGAVLTFLIPAGGGEKRSILTWEEAEKLPWGVLLLFGGGISIGRAVSRTGLSEWIGNSLGFLEGAPAILIVLVVVILVVYLTEVTSNVATMTTLAPILGSFALGLGVAPEALLGPAAVAASCAFMLPVATAPNAIVYASGKVTMRDMIMAGFWINIGAVIIITLIGTYLAPLAL